MAIVYQIKVEGKLKETWSEWFNGMAITFELEDDALAVTTLIGPVIDQTALHGLLCKIRDLGLPLVHITRIETDKEPSKKEKCQKSFGVY